MDKQQATECLNIVIQAERDMEQAKEDYKTVTDSAFDTYELTPDQIKAVKKVAKAMLKDKVQGIDDEAAALIEMIDVVRRDGGENG